MGITLDYDQLAEGGRIRLHIRAANEWHVLVTGAAHVEAVAAAVTALDTELMELNDSPFQGASVGVLAARRVFTALCRRGTMVLDGDEETDAMLAAFQPAGMSDHFWRSMLQPWQGTPL